MSSLTGRITCHLFIKFRNFKSVSFNKNVISNIVNGGYVAPIFNNKFNLIQFRNYCSVKNEEKKEDGIEKIYYGLLTPQIKAVKIISFTTSIGGLILQPILLKQASSMEGGLPIILGLCGVVGFFTFVTPILLHIITKKYITHLTYDRNTDKYTATIITFFCRNKKIEFSPEDVSVPDVPGMFTSFKVKGIPLFVDPKLFTDAGHYGKLMGYHKPMDFHLMDVKSVKKT